MNPTEYRALSERTEKKFPNGRVIKGLADHIAILNQNATQLGDALDHIKRHLIYDKALPEHIANTLNPEDKSTIKLDQVRAELYHAALGKVTEAIEFYQMVAAAVFEGKSLDAVNAVEEIGDGWWYDQIVLRLLPFSAERVMDANITKLAKRFPDKFSELYAIERDVKAERVILESLVENRGTIDAEFDENPEPPRAA
jgi:hypothetical protein